MVLDDNGGRTQGEKMHGITVKAKAAVKKVLRKDNDHENRSYEAALEAPAFDPDKFINRARIGKSGLQDKAIGLLQGTAEAIVNPKEAIKQRATRKTAGVLAKSRPYLSRKADLDFLEAQDDLARAEQEECDGNDEDDIERKAGDINARTEVVEGVERARQEMRVAWMTARHVRRVRIVDFANPPPFPDDGYFETEDDCGFPKFDWGKWLGYKILNKSHGFTAQYIDEFDELPFEFDTLRKHIERLIMVSAPLQSLFLDMRNVYRWENPVRTAKWLAVYFIFWYISHIMTFFYGYIIYSVLMNYFHPRSSQSVRGELAHSFDRGATALKVGELMDKHGPNGWLEPLLDQLGPFIQVQVIDMASFLEVCDNFYHFRSPSATLASLCLFASLFILSIFGDAKFALKVFWLIVGIIFFGCWPISSTYPRYRLLVSPLKWAFWSVPNHAEWCFEYLQTRAAAEKSAILSSPTPHDDLYVQTGQEHFTDSEDEQFYDTCDIIFDDEKDILSFGCTYLNVPGRFIISTSHLRFVPAIHLMPHHSFRRPYSDLLEMCKRKTKASVLKPLAKVTTGLDKLVLHFKPESGVIWDGNRIREDQVQVMVLENMRGRDKAFNAVIGFSGLKWQHLQKKFHDTMQKEEGKT